MPAVVVLRSEQCSVGVQICDRDGLPGERISTVALDPLCNCPSLVAVATRAYNRVSEPI